MKRLPLTTAMALSMAGLPMTGRQNFGANSAVKLAKALGIELSQLEKTPLA